jgi:two-component system, OmpR family, alkaline phosphatase synthesis response regulator PhoP
VPPQLSDLHSEAYRGGLLTREEILQQVWQYDSEVNSRTVDVHVAWLRQKLDRPQSPRRIQTERGKGYKFTPQRTDRRKLTF